VRRRQVRPARGGEPSHLGQEAAQGQGAEAHPGSAEDLATGQEGILESGGVVRPRESSAVRLLSRDVLPGGWLGLGQSTNRNSFVRRRTCASCSQGSSRGGSGPWKSSRASQEVTADPLEGPSITWIVGDHRKSSKSWLERQSTT